MSHAGWIFRELQKKQADFNELKQRCKKGWIKTLHNDVRD